MLILTRRENEALVIGEDIVVTVMGIKGNQVRIGIDAPKDVLVLREELVGDPGAKPAAPISEPTG